MHLVIRDKRKKEVFISVFQLLKSSSSFIHASFRPEDVHVQGMDKSHVCLFDLTLKKEWFSEYKVEHATNVCFDSAIFYSMISIKSDDQELVIQQTNDETLSIELVTSSEEKDKDKDKKKGDYHKYFTLPLLEYEYEELAIPDTDYDAEFSLPAKKVTDIFSQLGNFGDDLKVHCSEDWVDFITKGTSGEMRVNIPVDDMVSYSVVEGEQLQLNYSLLYLNKMCVSNKLSPDIDFYVSNESPMKIAYLLEKDSVLWFYMAPKMAE